uniref:Uncharacterized protein n=1 Tax=Anguilla anguilla TaxID=7936 RepID=A0A0E9VBG4_ANGAN
MEAQMSGPNCNSTTAICKILFPFRGSTHEAGFPNGFSAAAKHLHFHKVYFHPKKDGKIIQIRQHFCLLKIN